MYYSQIPLVSLIRRQLRHTPCFDPLVSPRQFKLYSRKLAGANESILESSTPQSVYPRSKDGYQEESNRADNRASDPGSA